MKEESTFFTMSLRANDRVQYTKLWELSRVGTIPKKLPVALLLLNQKDLSKYKGKWRYLKDNLDFIVFLKSKLHTNSNAIFLV